MNTDLSHDVLADFDEADYLFLNPDVAEAVKGGRVSSARKHWEEFGVKEGRRWTLIHFAEEPADESGADSRGTAGITSSILAKRGLCTVLLARGRRQAAAGKFEEALVAFREAAQVAPMDLFAHGQVSRMLLELGRFEEASAAAKRALDLEPKQLDALEVAARAALQLKRFEEGRDLFSRLSQLVPGSATAKVGIARCSMELGFDVLASLVLEEVLEAFPGNAEAKECLQLLAKRRGN